MKFLTNFLVAKFSDGIREGFHISLTKYPSLIFVFLVVNVCCVIRVKRHQNIFVYIVMWWIRFEKDVNMDGF